MWRMPLRTLSCGGAGLGLTNRATTYDAIIFGPDFLATQFLSDLPLAKSEADLSSYHGGSNVT